MDRIFVASRQESSLLSTHKVLRNTYFLLSLTLGFSALSATISTALKLPRPGLLLMLIGFYSLMFFTHKLANGSAGILSAFALTGFMGYTLGPILSSLIADSVSVIIMVALCGTALVFCCSSAYVLTTRKNMSFLSGMMLAGFIVLIVGGISNLFLQLSALHLALSGMLILFSAGAILSETSNIIHGGETNYIRATVSLYASIYNLFISLLSILGIMRNDKPD
ncbi:MAG: Bax inhibitor-1 family protein [Candidatus Malihini olakiniferum]